MGGGGFVAGPAGLAGLGMGLPLVLTEADSHLGLTNRLLAHRASAVCLAFPIEGLAEKPFRVTGRPLPDTLLDFDRTDARRRFGVAEGELCVLVVGGSLGARSLNLAAVEALRELDAKVIHISGERDFELVSDRLDGSGDDRSRYTLLRYEPGLGEVLAASDLVVGRSGGSVFELCAAGKPALLIPYPHATADHQVRNAEWMASGGAARILPDPDLTPESLRETVSELLSDRIGLSQMASASLKMARPDSSQLVADAVVEAASGSDTNVVASDLARSSRVTSRGAQGGDLEGRSLHFIGVGGAGMSALASIAISRGARVTGSDRADSATLDRLRSLGVELEVGHDSSQVPAEAEVVVSSAIDEDNPELTAARTRGQRVLHRGELLAEFARERRLIAVSGTHGKTTTTALIAHLLTELGKDPCFFIGGELAAPDGSRARVNSRWGSGAWLVTEADESDASFLELTPEIAVVTNLELDHHSRWTSLDELRGAFQRFVASATGVVQALSTGLVAPERSLEFAVVDAQSSVRAGGQVATASQLETIPGGTSFRIDSVPGLPDGEVMRLGATGRHNVANAIAALSAVGLAGLLDDASPARVSDAMESFPGVGRRLERRGRSTSGALVYDDYAHHPTEVAAVLEAARDLGARRVIALFQPHLYSRTKALSVEFGRALSQADEVAVLEVYPAREEPVGPLEGVTGRWVAEAVADAAPGKRVWWLPTLDEAVSALRPRLEEGDLLLTIGAGNVDSVAERLISGEE